MVIVRQQFSQAVGLDPVNGCPAAVNADQRSQIGGFGG